MVVAEAAAGVVGRESDSSAAALALVTSLVFVQVLEDPGGETVVLAFGEVGRVGIHLFPHS